MPCGFTGSRNRTVSDPNRTVSTIRKTFQNDAAVLFEPAVPFFIFRKDPEDFVIEAGGVVHFLQVAELMDHNAVQDFRGRQHQEAVEIQVAGCAAAAGAAAIGAA